MAQGDNFDLNDRQNKIIDIVSKYEDNIMRTKSYTKDAFAASKSIGKRRKDIVGRMFDRQYSRNTYMGLTDG